MTIKHSGPRGLKAAWMAWNRPGGGRPSRGAGGGGFGDLLNRLPSFGGGGNGGTLRWAGIALAVWLLLNSFVLITE